MIRFITLEGGDGSGKSTQLGLLSRYLSSLGKKCIATREPGGTPLGTAVRRLLLNAGPQPIALHAELFLYLADRAQHVQEVIAPSLKSGMVVLCDRHTDSTLAYQGYGRGIDLGLLRQLNTIASGGIRPDLTLLFDCPAEVGLSRTARRQSQLSLAEGREDRFEREQLAFHERVRYGFLQLASEDRERIRVIDASRSTEEVFVQVKHVIDARLEDLP